MATTRKPRPKKQKEEETLKTKKVEEKFPETLSPQHLLSLETLSRDLENSKLLMALEEQSLVNMELKMRILNDNIIKQRLVVKDKAERYEGEKKKYTSYKKEIWPLYGFNENEGLGYEPLTGNIVKN
jgi:hypothetical protein